MGTIVGSDVGCADVQRIKLTRNSVKCQYEEAKFTYPWYPLAGRNPNLYLVAQMDDL